ncbi:MAG TPA: hypothetical protein PKC28_14285 [Bdellovibrionales bacterium]|nr:hypothetical protein [Bdellovibrionales bacterium]
MAAVFSGIDHEPVTCAFEPLLAGDLGRDEQQVTEQGRVLIGGGRARFDLFARNN